MNSTPWYDDKAQMIGYLYSIEKFHQLIDARRQARRDNDKVRLNDFIIRGRYVLDTFGQVSNLTKMETSNYDPISIDGLNLPVIMTKDELLGFLPEGSSWTMSMGASLPEANTACQCCFRKWSIDTIHESVRRHETVVEDLADYEGLKLAAVEKVYSLRNDGIYWMQNDILIRNDMWINNDPCDGFPDLKKNEGGWSANESRPDRYHQIDRANYVIQAGDHGFFNLAKYYHEDCLQRKINNDYARQMVLAVGKSTVGIQSYTEIPNEYGTGEYNGVWLQITTDFGVIIVGWRRRVMALDYTGIINKNVFPDADTTNEVGMIHVNNYEHLTSVLNKLTDSL